MDESKLQELEREIGLRYRLGPKDGWATRTMQDLISEVRRLKAENERLNACLSTKSQSATEAWESRERRRRVTTAPLSPQFEQISRTEFIAGFIAGHKAK